jgi:branched-chain amino acid transport system substrate-binding protein
VKIASRLSLRSLRAALAALGMLAGAATAAEIGVTDTEIVIGQSITLQGGKYSFGVAAAQGMKLYFDAVNAAGGVNGRKIVLRALDDDDKGPIAEANARKLVQDGVFILFGAIGGGPSTAVMKVSNETKVPFFGPMAGAPNMRRPHQALVFPVRAEHRDEFRALMQWGKTTGLNSVGFLHSDTAVGKQHLENVKNIAKELGMTVSLAVPLKGGTTDEQLDGIVKSIGEAKPDLFINHASPDLYQKLVFKAKTAGIRTTFMAVNQGSYEMAKGLGPVAQGMVFSQVVPSPWERKREIAREYQDMVRQAKADHEFSYGGLEGFMTAKALVHALRVTGRNLTRANFVQTLENNAKVDLGGITLRYGPGDHEGSRFVDLSIVAKDGRFIH